MREFVQVSLRLSPEVGRHLAEAAIEQKKSRTQIVAELVEAWVKKTRRKESTSA